MKRRQTNINLTLILLVLIAFVACEKEDDLTPNNTSDNGSGGSGGGTDTTIITPTPSQRDLLANKWVLYETYENNVQNTTNGTDSFEYAMNGSFLFKTQNGWQHIGIYSFLPDSTAFNMLFSGTSNVIQMNLDRLDENELHTRFNTNGSDFLYKYRR